MEGVIMSEQKKEIAFAVACVNDFASKYNLSVKEAFQYLFRYKGVKFLKENYEIEHTLSWEVIMYDLQMLCRKNGGMI